MDSKDENKNEASKYEDEYFLKKLKIYSDQLEMSLDEVKEKKISKNQLKKMLKNKVWCVERIEKRKIQRQKRKLKLKSLREKNGGKLEPRIFHSIKDSPNKIKIAIDLSLESYMNDRELQKTFKQIQRCYAINRRSKEPCQFYLTSVTGRVRQYFDGKGQFIDKWDINLIEDHWYDYFKKNNELEKVIFLSSDSNETLPESNEICSKRNDFIFIIGGLVDHNFHKNLTLSLADEKKIPTARLPIDEHLKMAMTRVLAINQVFELILSVSSGKKWKEVLEKVIPSRKIVSNKVENVKSKVENVKSKDESVKSKERLVENKINSLANNKIETTS